MAVFENKTRFTRRILIFCRAGLVGTWLARFFQTALSSVACYYEYSAHELILYFSEFYVAT